MPNRSFVRSRPAKKIHTLRWDGIAATNLALSAGSSAINILAAGGDAETILRIRGWFTAWLRSAAAPAQEVLVSAGLILVPEGQGTTVIWDPFNDVNAPWIWFEETVVAYTEKVTDVIDVPGMTTHRLKIDNKAMRKASPDEELQLVVTNSTLGIAAPVAFNLAGRILLGH